MNKVERRIQYHQSARQKMLEGDLKAAVDIFKQGIDECGPHVGLLCDYAGCFYEMGHFNDCWIVIHQIQEEFAKAEHLLSKDSKVRTWLSLGKFHEEMAEPDLALNYYHQALNGAESKEDRQWIYINELRLRAYFGKAEDLQTKYLAVTEMKDVPESLKMELLHGLMWAEFALFGYEQSLLRMQGAMKSNLNILDQRLLARDFLEISIISNNQNSSESLAAAKLLTAGDSLDYDKALIALSTQNISHNEDSLALTPMMKLRLLMMRIKLSPDDRVAIELRKKYNFLLKGLSSESRSLFKRIEPQVSPQTKVSATLHISNRRLSLNGQQVKLTKMQEKFLRLFAAKADLDLNQISLEIWEVKGDEGTYHRLRMLVYKLNDLLKDALGFQAFEVQKNGASMTSRLQILLSSL